MRLYLSVFIVVFVSVIFISPAPLMSSNGFDSGNDCFFQDEDFYFVTMKNDTGGWYYQILKGNKRIIIQKHIPAIQGEKAFSDSTQAANVAHLMCEKLEKGSFPPSISIQELDSLKIIYKKQF